MKKTRFATRLAAGIIAALMLAPISATATAESGDDNTSEPLLVYTPGDTVSNIASGTVTLTQPEKRATITHYNLYWGNDEGKIEGYTAMKPLSGKDDVISYTFDNTLIPEGTTRLIAYAVKGGREDEYASVSINTENAFVFGELKYTLSILSDIHITKSGNDLHATHFKNALAQLDKCYPDSLGLLTVGDNVDGSNVMTSEVRVQYSNFKTLLNESSFASKFYPTIGNHDLFLVSQKGHDFVAGIFTENFDRPLDYDVWLNDSLHIIVLGDSEGGDNNATITEEQANWLDEKMSERYGEDGVVTLVSLHQPLYKTVAGTFAGQGWNGVDDKGERLLRQVFRKYPDAIMVNGHTHWEFDSKGIMCDGGDELPYIFLVPSCGYLWTDAQTYKEGSQGFVLEVYDNAIRMRGRDFGQDKWAPQADFVFQMKESANTVVSDTSTDTATTNDDQKSDGDSLKTVAFVLVGVAIVAIVAAIAIPSKKK